MVQEFLLLIMILTRMTNMFVKGGDAALTDELTADGQNGVSFIHPMGEIFLQPLAGEINQFQPCFHTRKVWNE